MHEDVAKLRATSVRHALTLTLFPVQSDMWELLFHSNKHGQSFNTFMGKVGKLTTLQSIYPTYLPIVKKATAVPAAAATFAAHDGSMPTSCCMLLNLFINSKYRECAA